MELTPELQNEIDKELTYLKSFNNNYLDESLDFYLEDCDSQIKPIIEAIALLSARTQITGKQQIDLLHQRLIKQIVSYLVSPIPAMGLIKLDVEQLIEPVSIVAGTELILRNKEEQEASFTTLFDIPLQALAITNIGTANKNGDNSQLILKIDALNDYPSRLKNLPLCLYGQGNYQTAIRLKHLLQSACESIEICFDKYLTLPFKLDFSALENSAKTESVHPLSKARQFFQLPHQNAFVQLHPQCSLSQLPEQWRSCQINFNLKCNWPKDIILDRDLMQLFVVAVENKIFEQTDPIFYQGTVSQFRILSPSVNPNTQLCSVRGVYQIKEGEYIPLSSSAVGDEKRSYEIAYPQSTLDNGRQFPQLLLNMPEAFDDPVKIMLDAYWHQPQFSKAINQAITIHPADLDITGVKWDLLNIGAKKFVPFTLATTVSLEQLIELAALKNKPILTLPELLFLLHALSSVWQGEFKVVKPLIKQLDVQHQYKQARYSLNPSKSEKPILAYTLSFHDFDLQLKPLVDEFLYQLESILQCWISHHTIHVLGNYPYAFIPKEQFLAEKVSATESNIEESYGY